ncbi:hypothetical protein G9U51_11475 [Calidifontibacter sp. DB0510]|uniref:DUF485 domain-containing protein n=1 Tax=Metallococcus carri TaxID=1656884 RepID=A0A967B6C2_9MICO|nr:hypothetical protein [Metallococcus carri]NHN56397.1 hypothetical protein [Metallococcus carri]NOP36021.1 hypothetical protein [Calidifontibacter sp. DB2511S]
MATEPPQRVRVTSSRRGTVRPPAPSTDAEGRHTAYLSSLMRAQLLLSVRVLVVGTLALGALPALFALVPSTADLRVAGIPFLWLALGVVIYPAAAIVGRAYQRAAERLEGQYRDLVGPR